jgi:hypothetical protein
MVFWTERMAEQLIFRMFPTGVPEKVFEKCCPYCLTVLSKVEQPLLAEQEAKNVWSNK